MLTFSFYNKYDKINIGLSKLEIYMQGDFYPKRVLNQPENNSLNQVISPNAAFFYQELKKTLPILEPGDDYNIRYKKNYCSLISVETAKAISDLNCGQSGLGTRGFACNIDPDELMFFSSWGCKTYFALNFVNPFFNEGNGLSCNTNCKFDVIVNKVGNEIIDVY